METHQKNIIAFDLIKEKGIRVFRGHSEATKCYKAYQSVSFFNIAQTKSHARWKV